MKNIKFHTRAAQDCVRMLREHIQSAHSAAIASGQEFAEVAIHRLLEDVSDLEIRVSRVADAAKNSK